MGAAGGAWAAHPLLAAAEAESFRIRYVLASAMYGDYPLREIVPEIVHTAAEGLDVWGKPHGTQREEIDEMGHETFAELLAANGAKWLVSSRYPLGPFGLQAEMSVLEQFGGEVLVCGATTPGGLSGAEARQAVAEFLEKIKPHADAAGERGLVIAVENHSSQIFEHPDAIRCFAELNRHEALGMAFAPHHLKDHIREIPVLLLELGKANLPFIYFQEYGIGAKEKVEKSLELQQLPGRGTLDYTMIVRALKEIDFDGYAEIFMHPTPRGVPVLDTVEEISELINESRIFVDQCLEELA